jgi:hypothetical protein
MNESVADESAWRVGRSIGLQLLGHMLLGGVVLFTTRLVMRSAPHFGAQAGVMTRAAIATARAIEHRWPWFAAGWAIFACFAAGIRARGHTSQARFLNWTYALAMLVLAAFLVVTISLSYLKLMQPRYGG